MYKEIDEAPGYSIYDDGRVMKTCKDCIHFEVCCYVDMFLPICDSFKDKSKFIEIPCSIGDEIWRINWRNEVILSTVSMLQQKRDKTWKIRLSDDGSVFDVTPDDIGKTIFLTREEAEKKLDENFRII